MDELPDTFDEGHLANYITPEGRVNIPKKFTPTLHRVDVRNIVPPPGLWVDEHFYRDMRDLLNKTRAGHAAKHNLGGETWNLWEDYTKKPTYYPFHNEVGLIEELADYYAELGVRLRKDGPLVAVELGPGSDHPVEQKTIPFLKALKPDIYVAVDQSPASMLAAMQIVKQTLPQIQVKGRMKDFNTDNLEVKSNARTLMFQFGTSASNMEGFRDGPMPKAALTSAIRNYQRNLSEGDYLILGLDQNQDRDSILRCYDNNLTREFAMANLHGIKEWLSPKFEPERFDYMSRWEEDKHLYWHGYVVNKDTSFGMLNDTIKLRKGEVLQRANTYKYPQEFMNEIYDETGFNLEERFPDSQKKMHHHILRLA